ncbi:MAG: hypothetical protein KAS66_04930 [Candidatus Omnitrophica bacterium]|nr:hypothetical protein [Candidatus Omnitrophota bacterium]
MSYVANPSAYKSLSSINLFQPRKKFAIKHVGFYDPIVSVNSEFTYRSGLLVDSTGKKLYDDSYLEGKPCTYFYFKHRMFGHNSLSKRVSKGHWHTKCFVSCNDTPVFSCARENEKKDVFFFADLLKDMPIRTDNETFALYVIQPTLDPEEIADLAMKTVTVYEWKADMLTATEKVSKAQGKEIVATKMMAQAIVTKNIYAKQIDSLIKLLASAQEKLFDNTGRGVEVLISLGDRIEKEFDLALMGPEAMKEAAQSMVTRQQSDLKYIEALTSLESNGDDILKRQVFDTCLNYVGPIKMAEWLNIAKSGNQNDLNSISSPSIATVKALEKRDLKSMSPNDLFDLANRLSSYSASEQFEKDMKSEDFDENDINNSIDKTVHKLPEENEKEGKTVR